MLGMALSFLAFYYSITFNVDNRRSLVEIGGCIAASMMTLQQQWATMMPTYLQH
jgi:hypothetical protein